MTSAYEFIQDLCERAETHEAARHDCIGRLARGDLPDPARALRLFAFQYGEYTRYMPRFVRTVIRRLDRADHKDAIQDLLDEMTGTVTGGYGTPSMVGTPHTSLYTQFQRAMGVDAAYRSSQRVFPEVEEWARTTLSLCDSPHGIVGIGAIGPGTDYILSGTHDRILEALDRFTDLTEDQKAYFRVYQDLDGGAAEALYEVAIDLAQVEVNRPRLERGMLEALQARARFWRTCLVHMIAQPEPQVIRSAG